MSLLIFVAFLEHLAVRHRLLLKGKMFTTALLMDLILMIKWSLKLLFLQQIHFQLNQSKSQTNIKVNLTTFYCKGVFLFPEVN